MVEISKSDWKLFRERIPDWQENYMGRLIEEYIKLLKSSGNPSDRFWKLEKRIKQDRKHPGVLIELRKSEALWDIVILIRQKVITVGDLDGFSEDLKDTVKELLDMT
jgi:hypothetical protein